MRNLELILDKEGKEIGKRFKCHENDNEVKFYYENNEFHFRAKDAESWYVIGADDLLKFIHTMEFPNQEG